MILQNDLTKVAVVFLLFFIGIISSAAAENWVRVVSDSAGDTSFIDVDVDSIHQGDDGLVYYSAKYDPGVSPVAVDCQERRYYVIGDNAPDWKSKALSYLIPLGGDTATEVDFVCAQVSKQGR